MLLGPQGKRINVNAGVSRAGVVLEVLDNVEVRSFTLRETILAVQLQLGSHNGVLSPAVHVQSGLSQHEGSGIRHERASWVATSLVSETLVVGTITRPVSRGSRGSSHGHITSSRHLEETVCGDESIGTIRLSRSTEGVDGRRQGINGIGVVEGLGTKSLVEDTTGIEGRAVVNVGIRLDNPDELLARVVEVQLDLVGGRSDRLITSELELLDQILMGVLGHLAALIRVQEDVVHVERGSHKRLLVGLAHGLGSAGGDHGLHCPQALTNGAEINVDLDFVILYESLIPSLSGYLSAFSNRSTYYI